MALLAIVVIGSFRLLLGALQLRLGVQLVRLDAVVIPNFHVGMLWLGVLGLGMLIAAYVHTYIRTHVHTCIRT